MFRLRMRDSLLLAMTRPEMRAWSPYRTGISQLSIFAITLYFHALIRVSVKLSIKLLILYSCHCDENDGVKRCGGRKEQQRHACIISMFFASSHNECRILLRVIPPVALSPPFVPRAPSSRSLIQRGFSGAFRIMRVEEVRESFC